MTVKELRLRGREITQKKREQDLVLTFRRTALVETRPPTILWKTCTKICDNSKKCNSRYQLVSEDFLLKWLWLEYCIRKTVKVKINSLSSVQEIRYLNEHNTIRVNSGKQY